MSASGELPAGSVVLLPEEVKAIRHALLIGLDSYGEIERLSACAKWHEEKSGQPLGELRPLHPTGNDVTISDFAAALRHLED